MKNPEPRRRLPLSCPRLRRRFAALLRSCGSLLFAVSGLAAVLFAGSCSRLPGKLFIMEGSFHYSRNRYPEAISAYMKALDYPEAAPYAEYGLSYVYFGLDEGEAALERLAAAREALVPLPAEEHRELIYRVHYNTGIILFWKENYTGAAAEFRKALETDGGRVEAKRNLELSLLSSRSPEGAGQAPPVDRLGGGEGADTLFEYIRWKERDRWKSREWVEDTSVSGPDY